jgi:hypothetical protein
MAEDYLAAFQTFADLEPMPKELACRFTWRLSPERCTAALVDRARRLHINLQNDDGRPSFVRERLVEEAIQAQHWLKPEFLDISVGATNDVTWSQESGWLQVRLPDCFRWVVEHGSPYENSGQTIVNHDHVFDSCAMVEEAWERARRPIFVNSMPEVVLAHVQPRLLLGGWAIHTRVERAFTVTLNLVRRYPVGSAPDAWEEDWPVPYFSEADQVVLSVDRLKCVITSWESLYHGEVISNVRFTDIDTDPHLSTDDFDPVRLGLSSGPPAGLGA